MLKQMYSRLEKINGRKVNQVVARKTIVFNPFNFTLGYFIEKSHRKWQISGLIFILNNCPFQSNFFGNMYRVSPGLTLIIFIALHRLKKKGISLLILMNETLVQVIARFQ